MGNEFKIRNGIIIDTSVPVSNITSAVGVSVNPNNTLITEYGIKSYVDMSVSAFGGGSKGVLGDINASNGSGGWVSTDILVDVGAITVPTPVSMLTDSTSGSFSIYSSNVVSAGTNLQLGYNSASLNAGTSTLTIPKNGNRSIFSNIVSHLDGVLNSDSATVGQLNNYTTSSTFNSHVGSVGSSHGNVTTTSAGFMLSTDKVKLDTIATNANNYSLPIATTTVLGGVKDGVGVSIDGSGIISVDYGTTAGTSVQGNDNRLVVSGGTTGQTLSKLSNTNYDYGWTTPSGAGDMLKSQYASASTNVVDNTFNSYKLNGQSSTYYATSANLNAHIIDYNNPHQTTKTQVGLSAVDNTSDMNKPISTLTQTALNLKFDTSGINQYVTTASLLGSDTVFDGQGVVTGLTISIGSPTSTFSISSGTYHKMGVSIPVVFPGVTNQTATNIATQKETYLAINVTNNSIVQSSTPFTSTQRRTYVVLGLLVHTNNSTINAVNNLPDVAVYSLSQLNDFMDNMGVFNVNGNVISANGANLSINKSFGTIYKKGCNFSNNILDPNVKDMPALTAPTDIRMRMQNGVESSDTSVLNLQYESPLGTLVNISPNKFVVFRVVLFPSNLIRIQYGQQEYDTMADAVSGINSDSYVIESNMAQNGLLRGFIIVKRGTTSLQSTIDAKFISADKFGSSPTGGSGGGITTLQGAYNNSIEPEILTNSTLGALSVKRGSTSDSDNVFEIINGAGTVKLYVKGSGDNNFYPYTDVKDPTGFTDPSNIVVTYNSTDRTITLTGNVKALWRGSVVSVLVSGWVSDPHPITLDQNYFLYYDGVSFVWSTTSVAFDMLHISEVYYKTTNKFAVREVHGFMDYITHQECHYNIGTWKKSGGGFSSFTLNSTTVSNRRPVLGSTVIVDEDIETTNASVSTGQYTNFNLTGSTGTPVMTSDQADILSIGAGGRFNYNLFTGGNWTVVESSNNDYAKFFVVNIPVTSDVGSQKFRTLYLMAQSVSQSLPIIQSITPASYNWGSLSGVGVSEFVYVGEIVVRSTTNNWQLISVSTIGGNKMTQITIPTVPTPTLSQVLSQSNDAGNIQIINVANATSATHVPNYGQLKSHVTGRSVFKKNGSVTGNVVINIHDGFTNNIGEVYSKNIEILSISFSTGISQTSQATSMNIRLSKYTTPNSNQYGVGSGTQLSSDTILTVGSAQSAQYYRNSIIDKSSAPLSVNAGEMLFVDINTNFWSFTDVVIAITYREV